MKKTVYSAPAVDKLLDIIEFLADKKRPYGVSELSQKLDISNNAIFRIMARLVQRGYAQQDEATKGYLLTQRLFSLAVPHQEKLQLRQAAHCHLETLSDACGETAQLHIPADRRVEVLDVVTPASDFYLQVTIGAKLYYHANAFGKAILAFMDQGYVASLLPEELPQLTSRTITRREQLMDELDNVRRTGLAYDKEEYTQGVYCIGSPVFDRHDRVVGGVGITGMKVRFHRQRREELERLVRHTAKAISDELGYTGARNSMSVLGRAALETQTR